MKAKYFFIGIIIMLYHSCVTLENEDVVLKTDGLTFTGSAKQVANLKVELFGKWGDHKGFILYSFDDKRVVPYKYINTDKWDISINLEHDNSKDNYYDFYKQKVSITVNTKYRDSLYTGVKGTLIAKDYKLVTEAPNPDVYLYNRTRDNNGDFINSTCNVKDRKAPRYCIQSFYFMQDDSLQGQKNEVSFGDHLIVKKNGPYSNSYAVMLPNRTFVFITNKGNYVKFQLQSVHKDQPYPITKDSEFGYLTFRYFIQKDGTRNLKER